MLPDELLIKILEFIPSSTEHDQIKNLCELRLSHHLNKIIQYILHNTHYTKRTLNIIKKNYIPKFPQFYIWIKVFQPISRAAEKRYNYQIWKRKAQYLYRPSIQCYWEKRYRCKYRCDMGNRLCYIHKKLSLKYILIHFNCERI
jgi:hypothetical protein